MEVVGQTTSSAPMVAGRGFRRDIQGLRGVAVLLVVVFHVGGWVSGGFVGVDVFFVLSGFLIGGLLHEEQQRSGRIDLVRFFTRRARRLLPALSLLTTVTIALSLFAVAIGGQLRVATSTAVAVSLFGANVQLYRAADYFAPDAERNPLLHTWSLSLEEQFYLVLPVVFAVVAWQIRRRRHAPETGRLILLGLIGVGSVVSLALSIGLVNAPIPGLPLQTPERLAFYLPVTRAWEFGAGALLAIAATGRRGIGQRTALVVAPLGALMLAYAAWTYDAATPFPGVAALVPVVGTLLLLAAGTHQTPIGSLLSRRWLVWTGDLSYSWYLWHWPAIVFARALWPERDGFTVLAAAGSLLVAWVSYRLVEQRFRRDESLVGRRVLVLVLVAILVPVTTALIVRGINDRLSEDREVQLAAQQPIGRTRGCHFDRNQDDAWPREACLFPTPDGSGPTVLLLGDSLAASLSDGALAAARNIGANLAIWTWSGQPLVGVGDPTSAPPQVDNVTASLSLVEQLQPDVVIVSNRSPTPSMGSVRTPEEAERLAARDAAWASEVALTLDALTDRGTKVIWTSIVPIYPDASGLDTSLLRPEVQPASLERATVTAWRQSIVAALARVIDDRQDVRLFDPVPHLCGSQCSNVVDGQPLYYDDNHLNARGSDRLAAPLAELLTSLLSEGRAG